MIAMQYSFTLPADYDMTLIDRRIAEKGHLIDGFPGLKFKAYLSSRRLRSETMAENSYAPIYLWDEAVGISNFICGPGFVGLTGSFGWPSVKTWVAWRFSEQPGIKSAVFATREVKSISHYADLQALRKRESDDCDLDTAGRGALASLVGFEPTTWTMVRFKLWSETCSAPEGATSYDVGYVSHNAGPSLS